MTMLVMGHMNPDTDSIVAAIAYADLASKTGKPAKAVAQGAVTPESDFVLKKFGLAAPEIVKEVAGQKLALVDTTEKTQLPADLDKAEILAVVDHHKLGDVTTPNPLEMWVWPVGCTCTVLKSMYDFYGVEVPKGIAGAMLCAILSDTVMFKSVTCTPADKAACEALAKIAGVADMMALGMDMFKVKSAVDGTPMRDLVFRDYKDFDMAGHGVGIGQLEVVDGDILKPYVDGLYEEIKKLKQEKGHHTIILMLTDIMKEGSEMLFVSDDKNVFKKAFGVEAGERSFWLAGCMSRKKQVVPDFQAKAFA
ncbi:manganese-dependent inorganic pyrophosphatase [Desulfocurvus sp.]|uniref:manganese-dependent inorganic pyrophosphatase n=1 Tax=Desulfocurvus sp. TaxID=2871698 RepID=UPI0025BCF2FA|nr:manganese-dependent inorganic pyrophosphatase [Desulfocurvus sp.]MCK9240796.1 manganese-dependent inorganic pyrophosphatase [Desulfocurvus sp.]